MTVVAIANGDYVLFDGDEAYKRGTCNLWKRIKR